MSDSNYSEQDTKNDTVETNPTKVFFKTLFQQVIWLIIYIFVGGYMLYCSKISQSGLMPTDIKLMPYRSESALPDKPIEPIININYIKEKDITLTNKIYFPYIYNIKILNTKCQIKQPFRLFLVFLFLQYMHLEYPQSKI